MKKFVVTFIIFSVVLLMWILLGMKSPDRGSFLPPSVLDRATPLNVNIDIEFIRSLKDPAYGK